MKKLFTTMAILALVGLSNVCAQTWQKGDAALARTPWKASITPGENQLWWGYANSSTQTSSVGVNAADTYHCAIFIPGDNPVAAGKTINAIRFALYTTNATDVSAWISTVLPSSPAAANVAAVAVDEHELGGIIDVALPAPYTLTDKGVYVGYSFTIPSIVDQTNDNFPVVFTLDEEIPNALILRTDNAVTSWGDLYGQGFGRLFLQVLLEGNFSANGAVPSAFDRQIVLLGKETTASVPVTCTGTTPVSSISYVITADGETSEEQQVSFPRAINFGETGYFSVGIAADETTGQKSKSITITKVNGVANEATDASVTFTVITIDEYVKRSVAVEEFTGTGCGWCPRGMVGMENLREEFGDQFVGIAIHQYNSSDPMYIAPKSYAQINFEGAPSCAIDRRYITDPYYGTANDIADDFRSILSIPALANIEVEGEWNEDQTKVNAKATVKSIIDNANYSLEFVLIADSLTGTSTSWRQQNYYYQNYSASQLPDDLAQFGRGGVNGKSAITGWKFNDVAISSSYTNGVNQATGFSGLNSGDVATSEYTLGLPTKVALKNALKKDYIYVAALLVNENGIIENSAKARVVNPGEMTGISSATPAAATTTVHYGLDGRQLMSAHKGINIMRMGDGTVRKILVK